MIKYHEEVFLHDDMADALIQDLGKHVNKDSLSSIHGGRFILPNTSEEFRELLTKSDNWQNLYNRLNSPEFLQHCLAELDMTDIKTKSSPFFSRGSRSSYFRRVAKLKNRRVGDLSLLALGAYLAYIMITYTKFYFFRLKAMFSKKVQIDLLFDISQAKNGYSREIHRDSDSRLIVFLLYLNEIAGNGTGGNLDVFEYIGQEPNDPNPQPSDEECKLIKSVKPEKGKLLFFKNDKVAFHSVPEMDGFSGERIFCYGAFTVIGGENPNLQGTKKKLKTQWRTYF